MLRNGNWTTWSLGDVPTISMVKLSTYKSWDDPPRYLANSTCRGFPMICKLDIKTWQTYSRKWWWTMLMNPVVESVKKNHQLNSNKSMGQQTKNTHWNGCFLKRWYPYFIPQVLISFSRKKPMGQLGFSPAILGFNSQMLKGIKTWWIDASKTSCHVRWIPFWGELVSRSLARSADPLKVIPSCIFQKVAFLDDKAGQMESYFTNVFSEIRGFPKFPLLNHHFGVRDPREVAIFWLDKGCWKTPSGFKQHPLEDAGTIPLTNQNLNSKKQQV